LSNWPNISVETKIAPVEALRRWLRAGVEFMATKKGMAALAMAVHGSSELVVYSLKADQTVGQLLRRAVAAGEIRAEIDPRTCSVRWSGCATRDRPGWQAKVLGLIDIFIDGLRGDLKGETIDRPVTLFIRAALISPSAQACRLRGPTPQTA
jgi:hypothetical protein